ncbi:transcriptional regulator [Thiomicrorhabdus immobilis]|uniref:Transcriptional regulator n=2 Tax=Thiomicrorhabdus immobilis TaxID=2791037 RepID=A0ABN6CUG2_9GAMM|nr:transcriptional regulator [Thiomicrorhabdus immobilis]
MPKNMQLNIVEPSNKRGLARQQKFLEVAENLFLTHGYANSSVNEIVRLAGGSLGTLYRIFGNKLGLFEAVFKRKSLEIFSEYSDGDYWHDDLEQSLFLFGKHLQSVALSTDGLAIYRLVITENNVDQQEIQRIFYKFGPEVAISMLSNYLKKHVDAGRITLFDERLAASQFLEMVKGPFIHRALFGETILDEELDCALEQAVKIFIKGCST